MLERRSSKDNKREKSPPAQYFGFKFFFYNAWIAIGSDDMIEKECSFVDFSIRLLEISTVSVP